MYNNFRHLPPAGILVGIEQEIEIVVAIFKPHLRILRRNGFVLYWRYEYTGNKDLFGRQEDIYRA